MNEISGTLTVLEQKGKNLTPREAQQAYQLL